MANFHTNQLVVVANNKDMLQVLNAVGRNFEVRAKEIGYEVDLEGVDWAGDAFELLHSHMDEDYQYIFTPNPIGSEEWAAQHAGYEGAEMEKHSEYAALGGLAALLGGSFDVGFSVAPSGRPLSGTANVWMHALDDQCYLGVEYSTASESNIADIDDFFEGLPNGTYAFAFLESDEGDGHQEVSLLAGIAHGQESLGSVGDDPIGIDDVRDVLTYAEANHICDLAAEKDPVKRAMVYAASHWMNLTDSLEALFDLGRV